MVWVRVWVNPNPIFTRLGRVGVITVLTLTPEPLNLKNPYSVRENDKSTITFNPVHLEKLCPADFSWDGPRRILPLTPPDFYFGHGGEA